ncbi:biotin--[acetyl-CoA-carboxylase] ligase [Collinsella intestinalis]|uniref:biotin--[acetyl-CoA-carboxylase] ligase n=1 Tax=Collinsella intestinalis TaxID=147207 RepID=UPI0019567A57|nr:biotin--[acetyl-CoA-carboxylase] ligase [Collinsella intestinalis]MBM6683945.1 biotin--[acetyl-CoA-carboxylase] ligase [Collinsella intestinalis]
MFDPSTTDLSGSTLLALETVPSTNDIAVDAGRVGAEHGWAVRADLQTAGRGRRGHSWTSPNGSLYLSIVLRPRVPMQMLMGLPAVTSLGVLDALEGLGLQGRVGVKWPNDIVSVPNTIPTPHSSQFNRKLVGILVEARSSEQGAFAVAGIGANIISPVDAPPASPEVQAAIDAVASVRRAQSDAEGAVAAPGLEPISLAEALPAGAELPTREALAVAVRDAVLARVARWERAIRAGLGADGPLAPILSSYMDNLPMLGKPVNVIAPNGNTLAVGYFTGIDAWGRAEVKLGSGELKAFSAEVVSLREV